MSSGPGERDDEWLLDLDIGRLDNRGGGMKSPKWQAKEMRLGPESHGGILSKQM